MLVVMTNWASSGVRLLLHHLVACCYQFNLGPSAFGAMWRKQGIVDLMPVHWLKTHHRKSCQIFCLLNLSGPLNF